MISKFKVKSEFTKHVFTLMTGTVIAQAIPLLISPVLTRMYTPEDFGRYAIIVAFIYIFGVVANARYELAIMLVKNEEDAINVFSLGLLINLALSLTLLLFIVIFNDYLAALLNYKGNGLHLYFIPLGVFLSGFFTLLNYFNNRIKRYKDVSSATIVKSVILSITQLFFGYIKIGSVGLVGGQVISQMCANLRLVKNVLRDHDFRRSVTKLRMLSLAKQYRHFAVYSSGGALIGTVISYTHLLMMNVIFENTVILGGIFLAQKFISIPLGLISSSFSQVYFQKLTSINDIHALRRYYIKMVKIFFPISILISLIVLSIPNITFAYVLGEEWHDIGRIMKIMTFWFSIQFVSSSLSFIYTRLEKQKEMFYFDLLHLIISVSTLMLCHQFNVGVYVTLMIYTAVKSVVYLSSIFIALRFLDAKKN